MRKVRWGLLSTARINSSVAPGMRESPITELVGVASRELSKAEKASRELGAKIAFGSYEKMLASDEIDAVYVSLPNSLHAEWAIKAAEAGKHVLCEKPLASNSKEAETVVKACEKEKVLLMEAFMYRHHPQHAKVKEIILNGRIGEPLIVNTRFSFYMAPSENIRWRGDLAGGALMDAGCYCINVSRLIFDSEPIAAKAFWKFDNERGVDITTTGLLEFPQKRYATIACSLMMDRANRYEVIGTEGSIEITRAFTPGNADVVLKINNKSQTEELKIQGIDQYRLEVEYFSKTILDSGQITKPAENGLANMKAIDLIKRNATQ